MRPMIMRIYTGWLPHDLYRNHRITCWVEIEIWHSRKMESVIVKGWRYSQCIQTHLNLISHEYIDILSVEWYDESVQPNSMDSELLWGG